MAFLYDEFGKLKIQNQPRKRGDKLSAFINNKHPIPYSYKRLILSI